MEETSEFYIMIIIVYIRYTYTLHVQYPLDDVEIEMSGMVRKWGNSAAVRLPTSILQAAKLRFDTEIEVPEEEGRIVMEPVRPSETSVSGLLDRSTEANIPEKVDYGGRVGRAV